MFLGCPRPAQNCNCNFSSLVAARTEQHCKKESLKTRCPVRVRLAIPDAVRGQCKEGCHSMLLTRTSCKRPGPRRLPPLQQLTAAKPLTERENHGRLLAPSGGEHGLPFAALYEGTKAALCHSLRGSMSHPVLLSERVPFYILRGRTGAACSCVLGSGVFRPPGHKQALHPGGQAEAVHSGQVYPAAASSVHYLVGYWNVRAHASTN
eukprot:1160064-Pelagomonas_calceolata.AAC.8